MADIIEEVEEKFEGGKEKVDEYIDRRVDEEVQERVRRAVPWVLGIGAGIFLAYAMTRNGKDRTP